MKDLLIDEEFKKLIPPLSKEEFKILEENILKDGCIDPICTWNDIIIDGHNRYKICKKHNVVFKIHEISFTQREEVKNWICSNQLGRRNISEETKKYLIGKRYEMEKSLLKNSKGRNQYSEDKKLNEEIRKERNVNHKPLTAIKLGKEYQVSCRTVLGYATYAKAIDTLEKDEPELTQKILSGEINIPQCQVVKISKLTPKFKNKIRKYLKTSTNNKEKKVIQETKVTVKDMPEHDPDAEIMSLVFTVPSWIGSINRVLSVFKENKATDKAKNKLKAKLYDLDFSITTMLVALEE